MTAEPGDFAFVICQIGAPASETRLRTDELCDFILRAPLEERGLRLARSDEDPTPGTVTEQIVRSIVTSRVVIADLTGRNPNVYYELGIAHSFGKPLIILVDRPSSLAFDLQGERAIAIDDDGREIGARKARAAEDEVRRQLDVVLGPDYVPHSLVRSVGVTATLERFATNDPTSAQLVRITEQLEEIRNQRSEEMTTGAMAAPKGVAAATVTEAHIRYLSQRNELTLSEAATVLTRLSPQQLAALSAVWGLKGPPIRKIDALAEELGVTVPRASTIVRQTMDAIGSARRAAEGAVDKSSD